MAQRDDTIFYNVYSSFFWFSFTQRDGSTGYGQQVFSAITTLLHEISSIMPLITMEYRKKPTNRLKNRGDWRVSNSRHPQSQCSALPLSYNRHLIYIFFFLLLSYGYIDNMHVYQLPLVPRLDHSEGKSGISQAAPRFRSNWITILSDQAI